MERVQAHFHNYSKIVMSRRLRELSLRSSEVMDSRLKIIYELSGVILVSRKLSFILKIDPKGRCNVRPWCWRLFSAHLKLLWC